MFILSIYLLYEVPIRIVFSLLFVLMLNLLVSMEHCLWVRAQVQK